MIKLVGMIQPFDAVQTLYVYENGNILEVVHPTLDNLPDAVFSLKDKYNANKLDLVGATRFSKGYQKKILEEEVKRYSSNTLEINVL